MRKTPRMMLGIALIAISSIASAHQIDNNLQQKLMMGGKKYSFDFRDGFGVDTLKNLIEGELKIQVEIDPKVDVNKTSKLNIRNVTFLDYLYKGADSLNLEAIQKGQNKIVLVPKK